MDTSIIHLKNKCFFTKITVPPSFKITKTTKKCHRLSRQCDTKLRRHIFDHFWPILDPKWIKIHPKRDPQPLPDAPGRPKMTPKSPQRPPKSVQGAKMFAQGASRAQNDAKMVAQGASRPQNRPKWLENCAKFVQNGTKNHARMISEHISGNHQRCI